MIIYTHLVSNLLGPHERLGYMPDNVFVILLEEMKPVLRMRGSLSKASSRSATTVREQRSKRVAELMGNILLSKDPGLGQRADAKNDEVPSRDGAGFDLGWRIR